MNNAARQRAIQAGSFAGAAEAYERGRPSYPREAIAWLVPPCARCVLDLGAGTGKLTRQLVEHRRGQSRLEVLAVEPSQCDPPTCLVSRALGRFRRADTGMIGRRSTSTPRMDLRV